MPPPAWNLLAPIFVAVLSALVALVALLGRAGELLRGPRALVDWLNAPAGSCGRGRSKRGRAHDGPGRRSGRVLSSRRHTAFPRAAGSLAPAGRWGRQLRVVRRDEPSPPFPRLFAPAQAPQPAAAAGAGALGAPTPTAL